MKFRHRRQYEPPEINFIPLIDVLLVILIFLMITTTYSRYSQLDIKLPTAGKTAEEIAEQKTQEPILIAISEQGQLMVNDNKLANVEPKTLADALEAAAQKQDKTKTVVIINADAKATHQSVIKVMEVARNSGFSQLTFATQHTQ